MLNVSSVQDLGFHEKILLQWLRHEADVLLLHADDPWHAFKNRLKTMHKVGILNLSLATITDEDTIPQLTHKNRSLVCRLREANKRVSRANLRATRTEQKLAEVEKILAKAKSQVVAFRAAHPEWVPPEKKLLPKQESKEYGILFRV